MSNKCGHTEHCCAEHGCKYGDPDCPVWLGYKKQSYPCESCSDPLFRVEGREYDVIPEIEESVYLERRKKLNEVYFTDEEN